MSQGIVNYDSVKCVFFLAKNKMFLGLFRSWCRHIFGRKMSFREETWTPELDLFHTDTLIPWQITSAIVCEWHTAGPHVIAGSHGITVCALRGSINENAAIQMHAKAVVPTNWMTRNHWQVLIHCCYNCRPINKCDKSHTQCDILWSRTDKVRWICFHFRHHARHRIYGSYQLNTRQGRWRRELITLSSVCGMFIGRINRCVK